MFRQNSEKSIDPKSDLVFLSPKPGEMTPKMREKLEDYVLSLHGIRETSKEAYFSQMKTFGHFLVNRGIEGFQDASLGTLTFFSQGIRMNAQEVTTS